MATAGIEDTLNYVIDSRPLDVSLTPPAWRRQFAYLWEMPATSPWSRVRMAADPAGIELVATNRDSQREPTRLLVPPALFRYPVFHNRRPTIADILAGLAGGGLATDIQLVDVEGFDVRTGERAFIAARFYSQATGSNARLAAALTPAIIPRLSA